jgi:ribosomal protein S15P/S13E
MKVPYIMQPQTTQESAAQLAVIIGGLNARIAVIHQQLQHCEKHFQRKVEDLDTRFRLMTYNLSQMESLIRNLKNQQACSGSGRHPY